MKTTENISLAGYAFTIETDAYEELGAYLSDIRTCFSGDASADEIVADIEERVAELLRERCISGMVVDLTMVRDIKKRIGNPALLSG
jgi:glutamyl-tRNA reductase